MMNRRRIIERTRKACFFQALLMGVAISISLAAGQITLGSVVLGVVSMMGFMITLAAGVIRAAKAVE